MKFSTDKVNGKQSLTLQNCKWSSELLSNRGTHTQEEGLVNIEHNDNIG